MFRGPGRAFVGAVRLPIVVAAFVAVGIRARLPARKDAAGAHARRLAVATLLVAVLGTGMPVFDAEPVGESLSRMPVRVSATKPSPSGHLTPPPPPLLSTPQPDVPQDAPPPAKRTAVIVGINEAKGSRPLPGSHTDALNLREALLRYGFPRSNITMLLEGDATRPAILEALGTLAERTPTSGIAVVGIATHTRRRGGANHLVTAEGALISASELAASLAAVRARMWVALPTCYAGGYAIPGIVGDNRVATFASTANRPTYQAGSAGSFLFIHLVRRAMLEGHAPHSVQSAFSFARAELVRDYPEYAPHMSDGLQGDLVLGRMRVSQPGPEETPKAVVAGGSGSSGSGALSGYQYSTPQPTPTPRRRSGPVGVCGRARYNCTR